jgi:uridine kinase
MAERKRLWTMRTPRLVAIVGGSGAGKSWLAERLLQRLGKKATRVSLDDFYLDRSHLSPEQRARLNFDHPRSIDWKEMERAIIALKNRQSHILPQYDFTTHTRKPSGKLFKAKPIIIFDGLWLLWRPSLRRLFDLSIFVHCPECIRLERRRQRDCAERGRTLESVNQQFFDTVAPMHNRFVDPQRRWADIVFNHTASPEHLDELAEQMRTLVQ